MAGADGIMDLDFQINEGTTVVINPLGRTSFIKHEGDNVEVIGGAKYLKLNPGRNRQVAKLLLSASPKQRRDGKGERKNTR